MAFKEISYSNTGKGEFKEITPTTEEEIAECKDDIFIIKVGSDLCPPCRLLKEYLDKKQYLPPCDITMFVLQMDGENSNFVKKIARKLKCSAIPYTCVTNKSYEVIDSLVGFNEDLFNQFIEKNFGSK